MPAGVPRSIPQQPKGVHRPLNAYYGADALEFAADEAVNILGALTTGVTQNFRTNEREQTRAWEKQIRILQRAILRLPDAGSWGVLLEYSLHRLRRRVDAVLVRPGLIVVIEFKIGADRHKTASARQAEDYALCIRDFHSVARGLPIVPIVCEELTPIDVKPIGTLVDGVAPVALTNGKGLARVLQNVTALVDPRASKLTWQIFDSGAYNPTPNIIEAACAIYRQHSVADIGRSDAEGQALERAADRLRIWVKQARRKREHIVCFLTGTPGAGKTLLGLDLVLAEGGGKVSGEPAVMLTGNQPLVHVLKTALVKDAKKRGEKKDSARAIDGALQTLLDYLKQHSPKRAAAPPENVVVFDEAQRAWDEKTGAKLLQRRRSEPALFLEILSRLRWACLVCLVGPGQEINRGEIGMKLWTEALKDEERMGRKWRVVGAAPKTIATSGARTTDPALHLTSGLRSYRNVRFGQWVDSVLEGNISRASQLSSAMALPPAYIARDLSVLRTWLDARRRGGRRPGLLASSGNVRLVAEGVPLSPTSKELKRVEHWFLQELPDDYRGADSLETPLSEFCCQGLEVDYVGLCWGGDLLWSSERSQWIPRRISAPRWVIIRVEEAARYRVNAYRVLFTRAREGVCIFVPRGVEGDRTRSRAEYDEIASTLHAAGCQAVTI